MWIKTLKCERVYQWIKISWTHKFAMARVCALTTSTNKTQTPLLDEDKPDLNFEHGDVHIFWTIRSQIELKKTFK